MVQLERLVGELLAAVLLEQGLDGDLRQRAQLLLLFEDRKMGQVQRQEEKSAVFVFHLELLIVFLVGVFAQSRLGELALESRLYKLLARQRTQQKCQKVTWVSLSAKGTVTWLHVALEAPFRNQGDTLHKVRWAHMALKVGWTPNFSDQLRELIHQSVWHLCSIFVTFLHQAVVSERFDSREQLDDHVGKGSRLQVVEAHEARNEFDAFQTSAQHNFLFKEVNQLLGIQRGQVVAYVTQTLVRNLHVVRDRKHFALVLSCEPDEKVVLLSGLPLLGLQCVLESLCLGTFSSELPAADQTAVNIQCGQ